MKLLYVLLLAGILMFVSLGASARPGKEPKPDNGFWVIVSNEKTPDSSIVQFYDQKSVLLYEEHVNGLRIDIGSKRTRRRLNKSLQTALIAWNKEKELLKDKGFVAAEFKIGGKNH